MRSVSIMRKRVNASYNIIQSLIFTDDHCPINKLALCGYRRGVMHISKVLGLPGYQGYLTALRKRGQTCVSLLSIYSHCRSSLMLLSHMSAAGKRLLS